VWLRVKEGGKREEERRGGDREGEGERNEGGGGGTKEGEEEGRKREGGRASELTYMQHGNSCYGTQLPLVFDWVCSGRPESPAY